MTLGLTDALISQSIAFAVNWTEEADAAADPVPSSATRSASGIYDAFLPDNWTFSPEQYTLLPADRNGAERKLVYGKLTITIPGKSAHESASLTISWGMMLRNGMPAYPVANASVDTVPSLSAFFR